MSYLVLGMVFIILALIALAAFKREWFNKVTVAIGSAGVALLALVEMFK